METFQPGDFVTDGVLRGFILSPYLTHKLATHTLGIYRVNIGGGRDTIMIADQLTLIAGVPSPSEKTTG